MNQQIEACFPDLVVAGYHITSQATSDYNCIAWAADDDSRWWWPDPFGDYYWPAQAPRVETLEAFVAAYRLLGYDPCTTDDVEADFERIAIYVDSQGIPTHATRQLPSGAWTSKLGTLEDIEHTALEGLNGVIYGRVGQLLRRALTDGSTTP